MRTFPTIRIHSPKSVQCEALSAVLPGKVIGQSDTTGYQRVRKSYWTQQESTLSPACFFQPKDANDVSTAIKVLNQPSRQNVPGCKFAIKSGGLVNKFVSRSSLRSDSHTTWAGAANIEGGVTIDLALMKQVEVSPDRTFASVGPGNRWSEVYSKLGPTGLAVQGGRWGNVGVGGLLTGGEFL
jgi:FAD/FMN-containing dehydrogenase